MTAGIVQIHGQDYQTVAYRIAQFRADHPDWAIITERTDDGTSDTVCFTATIFCAGKNGTPLPISNGHAEESRGASAINKTSALENCETSAVGRALAFLGYGGIDIASANEMESAERECERLISELVDACNSNPESALRYWRGLGNYEVRRFVFRSLNNHQKGLVRKAIQAGRVIDDSDDHISAYVRDIIAAVDNDDDLAMKQLSQEMTDAEKYEVYLELTTEQSTKAKELTFREKAA